ncbi:cystatin-12 [Cricetulus griseus]|uniref:Cystatin-12 n=1 Tax=Cricetulus griseus TaxID=10029 RepID=A0A9J7JUU1_CRIGR|nr:cystatin-12 [Cricetulus griseus]XP_027276766.2 cystatin-12 [Cricetulus griseus]
MLWKVFLLVGLIVLGIHDCSFKFVEISKNDKYFGISVEYVVFHFNENQDDNFAYKFLRVRRSLHQKGDSIFLIDLEMGRTVCEKHDEDIDNCPLQKGQGERKARCTYIVESEAWITEFTILNSTCVHT